MRTTIGPETKVSRTCRSLAGFFKKWWVRYVLGPVVVSAPPGLVFAYLRFPQVKEAFSSILSQPAIDVVSSYEIGIFVGAVLYVYALTVIYGAVQGCAAKSDEIDYTGLLSLFETLERVVGAKAERFEAALRKVEKEGQNPAGENVFLRITQPDQQIALLTEGLKAFFDAVDREGVSFRVTVAAIEGGIPVEWFYFSPSTDPPRTPIEVLHSPNSAIIKCCKIKDLVIVEDLRKEVQKGEGASYACSDPKNVEEGSLVCYPVLAGKLDEIPYVITIVADKRRYFRDRKSGLYKWMFKRFALRVRLEHYLLALKERVTKHGP